LKSLADLNFQKLGLSIASKYLDLFLSGLIMSLEDDNKLLASVAAESLHELVLFFGASLTAQIAPKHSQMVKLYIRGGNGAAAAGPHTH